MNNRRDRILFLALDTFSRIGGLQRFNQRVISGLAALAQAADAAPPTMHIMRDTDNDLPANLRARMVGFGPRRMAFMRSSLSVAQRSDTLLLGQLNLLPVGWLAKKLNPALKLVLFVHGVEVWNDPVYRKRRFYEPYLLASVDRIASVSRYTADIMAREFSLGPDKFSIFPNAVDGPIAAPATQAGAPIILCVTRMAPHDHGKHVDSVLRAFALVRKKMPAARVEIVGDGALRPQLEALASSLALSQSVTFHGRVSDEELDACYRRASAFVLPSSKEGFGIVYLEAWKYGLPVICGDRGASKEVVTHGEDGFVVDPGNTELLASHMTTLLADRDRNRSMAASGMSKLSSRYLDEHFRGNLKALLEEVR